MSQTGKIEFGDPATPEYQFVNALTLAANNAELERRRSAEAEVEPEIEKRVR